jgi:hypothetical protein
MSTNWNNLNSGNGAASVGDLNRFLKSHPGATLQLVPALKYDIPLFSHATAVSSSASGIYWYHSLTQPYSSQGGLVQRIPVVWQVYVAPEDLNVFQQLAKMFKKR